MIAFPKQLRSEEPAPAAWHARFLGLLPAIVAYARCAFRHLGPDAREEAIQGVVCNACCAIARLAELGKLDLAYPTVLARFGVAQVKDGRMVGGHLNCRDVLSRYCQVRKSITVERLDRFDRDDEVWEEVLIPDQTCTPADLAASRIDFPAWLKTLKPRDRNIALKLAAGDTTSRVRRQHRLSPGRISQLRQELKAAWEEFTGESDPHAPKVFSA